VVANDQKVTLSDIWGYISGTKWVPLYARYHGSWRFRRKISALPVRLEISASRNIQNCIQRWPKHLFLFSDNQVK